MTPYPPQAFSYFPRMGQGKVKVMKQQKNLSGLKRSTILCFWFCSASSADGSAFSTFLQTNSSTSTSSFLVFTSSWPLCWVSPRLINMHPKGLRLSFVRTVGVLSSRQSAVNLGLNGWGSTPWLSTSAMSPSGELLLPLASQHWWYLMWYTLIFGYKFNGIMMAGHRQWSTLCLHWLQGWPEGHYAGIEGKTFDIWWVIAKTKWFKPRFWPGRCLLYISPSFFLLRSWLPGQFTTWSSFLRMPGFVQQLRLPLNWGGRGNRW